MTKETRGRPPKGKQAMSAAERMRRSYERKKEAGLVTIRVEITDAQKAAIPVLAAAAGYNTLSEFVSSLVGDGLRRTFEQHQDRIDMAHTARLMGLDKETVAKVLRGEITRLIDVKAEDCQ